MLQAVLTGRCRDRIFEELWEAALYAEGLTELDGRRHPVVECHGCDGYHIAGS